jgi:hypothetical protein
MRTNRTLVLIVSSVIVALIVAAFSAGVVGYAQQTQPTQLQPSYTAPQPTAPQPAKKPVAAKPKPQAQGQAGNAVAAQPQQAAAPQQPTVFDEHARQGNIATCANVFGMLGRGVATNSTFTAQSQWDAKAGNAHSVQSLVALGPVQNAPNNAQRAAGVVFAAPVGSACEGNLVRVTPSAESCPAVAAELAKLNGQNGALGDLSTITLQNGAQVLLIPLGNACVAVTALRIAG